MELTTVPNLKTYLRLKTEETDDDAMLQVLVDAANDAITGAISRNILSAQYTETRDGTGTSTLMLANTPVTAIGSLSIVAPACAAGIAPPTQPLVRGVDYVATQYSVKLYRGVFPRGIANVVIEYTAGFVSLPSDIVHATTKWAALRYREMSRLGHKSATLQGQTVQFDLDEMPPDVLGIVGRYQTKIPLVGQATGTV